MSSLRMASTAPNSAQRGSYSASRPSVMACFRGDCYKGSSLVSPTIESCRRSHGGASSGRAGPPSFSPVIPCEPVPPRARVCCARFCIVPCGRCFQKYTLWCRVVEVLLEIPSTNLSKVLFTLPCSTTDPRYAILPAAWGFFMRTILERCIEAPKHYQLGHNSQIDLLWSF